MSILKIKDENGNWIGIPTIQTEKNNYEELENLPKVNDVELVGNKSLDDLGIQPKGDYATEKFVIDKIAEVEFTGEDIDLSNYATKDELNNKVDKVKGKSLIDDTEISRLSKVDNYDDTQIKGLINSKADKTSIPTKVSQLENDSKYLNSIPSEYVTETELNNAISNKANKSDIPDVSGLETKIDANNKLTEAKSYTDTKIGNLIGSAPETLNTLEEVATAIGQNETVVSALNEAIGTKANKSEIPTKVSQLENDEDFSSIEDMTNYINEHKDELKGEQGVSVGSIKPLASTSEDGGQSVYGIYSTDDNYIGSFSVFNGNKGTQGIQGIQGERGVGVAYLEEVVKSEDDGIENVYDVIATDGSSLGTMYIKNGSKGLKGDKPTKGVDYWTYEDIMGLVEDLKKAYTILEGNDYHGAAFDNLKSPTLDNNYSLKIIRFGCIVVIQGYIYCHSNASSTSNPEILTNLPFAPIASFHTYSATDRDALKLKIEKNGKISIGVGNVTAGTTLHINVVYACQDR